MARRCTMFSTSSTAIQRRCSIKYSIARRAELLLKASSKRTTACCQAAADGTACRGLHDRTTKFASLEQSILLCRHEADGTMAAPRVFNLLPNSLNRK